MRLTVSNSGLAAFAGDLFDSRHFEGALLSGRLCPGPFHHALQVFGEHFLVRARGGGQRPCERAANQTRCSLVCRVHLERAENVRTTRFGRLNWTSGLVRLLLCTTAFAVVPAAAAFYHLYFDRNSLPDLEGFTRFEFLRSDTFTTPTASR